MTDDNAAIARAIIDADRYMVLGTADEAGLPWVTPVWFAPNGYRDFLWVSDPQRRHSWNPAVRPQVSIVIFDSTVPVSTGQAVASEHFVLGEQDERLPVSPSALPQTHAGGGGRS